MSDNKIKVEAEKTTATLVNKVYEKLQKNIFFLMFGKVIWKWSWLCYIPLMTSSITIGSDIIEFTFSWLTGNSLKFSPNDILRTSKDSANLVDGPSLLCSARY